MKLITRALITIAAIATLFALGTYYYLFNAGDKQALEELFPSDTLAYSDIKHVRKLGVKAATSDLVDTYQELLKIGVGAVAALGSQIDAETGLSGDLPDISAEEILKLGIYFNRQVAVGLVSRESSDPSKIAIPSIVTVAHFQGKANGFEQEINTLTEKINQSLDTGSKVSWVLEEWENNKIHILQTPEQTTEAEENSQFDIPDFKFCWTVIDTKFFASSDLVSLKNFIKNSDELPFEQSLASNENYLKLDEFPLERDASVFANVLEFAPTLVDLLEREMQDNGAAQIGISFSAVLEDIGFLSVDSLYSAIDLTPQNERFASGISLSSKEGLWSLMKLTADGYTQPETVPNDVYSAGTMGFDLGEMILWIKDLVLKNAPIAAIAYPQYKGTIDAFLGMDVEEFLDQSFKQDFQVFSDISVSTIETDGKTVKIPASSVVMVQELDAAEQFESKIEELILMGGASVPLETIEHSGVSYYKLDLAKMSAGSAGPQSDLDLTYCLAITHNKMLLSYGSEPLFKKALETLSSNGPGAFQAEDVAAALSALPNGEGGTQVTDLQSLFEVLTSVALNQIENKRESDPDFSKALSQIDWNKLRQVELKIATKHFEIENGFYSIGKFVEAK
ncbi:hypothetical protein MLD52_12045 [Puniceicoccaceae bacterium K14]|nr:hypothetical protein [Puniceicoccaceae bacterium K14]